MRCNMPSLCLLAFLSVACAPADPAASIEEDRAAIQALIEQELSAVRSGDVDAFVAVWADDILVSPPGSPGVSGGAAAREWVEEFTRMVTVQEIRYMNDRIDVVGDVAIHDYELEWTFVSTDGGEAMTERGKGIHVFRRQPDGSWKMTRDVWNDNAAPST